jgi:hypothetical protein
MKDGGTRVVMAFLLWVGEGLFATFVGTLLGHICWYLCWVLDLRNELRMGEREIKDVGRGTGRQRQESRLSQRRC